MHYRNAGFFVLRTPLLPLSVVRGLSSFASTEEEPGTLRGRLREELARLAGLPEVEEALYLASPDLHAAVARWRASPGAALDRKVEVALTKYVLRMAARSTPFGLFAGTAVGRIAAATELRVSEPDTWQRYARLDSAVVERLADRLGASEALLRECRYVPNPTLYRVGDDLRYYETVPAGGGKSFYLSSAEAFPELEAVLARARGGAGFADLATLLTDSGIEQEEADAFVLELVRNGLLVPDFVPSALGAPLDAQLLSALPAGVEGPAGEIRDSLAAVERGLSRLNATPLGVSPAAYDALRAPLDLPAENAWHVELVKGGDPRLAEEVAAELARAAEALHLLNRSHASDPLAGFRRDFAARFGSQEIPLLLALDDEYGVRLDPGSAEAGQDPLLQGFPFAGAEPESTWSREHAKVLARLFSDGVRTGEATVDPAELATLAERVTDAPPPAVAVLAELVPSLGERGRVVLKYVFGPNAVAFFGRFCHGDAELRRQVRDYVRRGDDAQPECLHAELNFLPLGRLGNVVARPAFRAAEITVYGAPSAETAVRIEPADLLLSVQDGRCVLRSRHDGRPVVPHLTTMHVAHAGTNLPLYRFFYLLQEEGRSPPGPFNWGPFATADFLPRVSLGSVILSQARWRVQPGEIDGAGPEPRDGAIDALRARRGIPRHVLLAAADNELRLDLANPLCGAILMGALRRGPVTLLEVCGGDAPGAASTASGLDFAHEIVVPFTGPVREHASTAAARFAAPGEGERSLVPGSRCLYVRIYGATSTADRLVVSQLAPLLTRHRVAGTLRGWFFVRYVDGVGPHLRLRVFGDPAFLWSTLLPELRDLLDAPGASPISSWDVATYEREVERYGGFRGAELAEELFCADAEAVAEALGAIDRADHRHRWLFALLSTHRYLEDFGVEPEARRSMAQRWSEGWLQRLSPGKPVPHSHLALRFREHRAAIEAVLGPAPATVLPEACVEALRVRSARLRPVVQALRQLQESGTMGQGLPELLESFVHMSANRVFPIQGNAYEAMLYDFLARYYRSALSRGQSPGGGAD